MPFAVTTVSAVPLLNLNNHQCEHSIRHVFDGRFWNEVPQVQRGTRVYSCPPFGRLWLTTASNSEVLTSWQTPPDHSFCFFASRLTTDELACNLTAHRGRSAVTTSSSLLLTTPSNDSCGPLTCTPAYTAQELMISNTRI